MTGTPPPPPRGALGLSRRGLGILAGLVVAGLAARIALAFATYGLRYDIDSLRIVADTMRDGDTGVYETGRWPYPPGFLPLVALADRVARWTGLPFHGVVQVPAIVADALLAVLVAWFLRANERQALIAAALVALGPSFALISGWHGQIDSVAILPAVAGAVVWVRWRRPVVAGLLIGLGAAIKTVPFVAALALLSSARSRREGAALLAAAAAVPLAAVAPFLALDADTASDALTSNKGVPGFGGLSALLQPSLTRFWATLDPPVPAASDLVQTLTDAQNVIVGVAVLLVVAVCRHRRLGPLDSLAAVWLTVLAVNPNPAYQYVVWVLPFLLLAGRLGWVAILQALLVTPQILLSFRPGVDAGGWLYWSLAELAWAGILVAWLLALTRPRDRVASCSP